MASLLLHHSFEVCQFQEITAEQELFDKILQSVVQSPYVVHGQCLTNQSKDTSSAVRLPTVKFDLVVYQVLSPPTSATVSPSGGIVVIMNGGVTEDPQLLLSSKTDSAIKIRALSKTLFQTFNKTALCTFWFLDVPVVLESLIWGELCPTPVALIISGMHLHIISYACTCIN